MEFKLSRSPSSCNNRPPWLISTLSELDGRIRSLAGDSPDSGKTTDSFAARAENYYQRRPELLRLLHDLHNHNLYLADRYCHAAASNKLAPPEYYLSDSDADSSISFQAVALPVVNETGNGVEALVVEFVSKEVERAVWLEEVECLERRTVESWRKTELQRSLVEVLESERVVLSSENARLGYRAEAAEEEATYMQRRAAELARCLVKMRDDHRVCVLGRKIEDLQAQIFGLEKRNKECYDAMARRESEKRAAVREACLQVERLKAENARLRRATAGGGGSKSGRWWGLIRKVDLSSVVFCGAGGSKEEANGC